jgi:hypothetical protein
MKRRVLILAVMLLLATGASLSSVQPAQAVDQTSYKVDIAFWTSGINPHYGAFYSGSNGRNQYYTGSSGQPSGYSSWDWWPAGRSVLLLEKSWLFTHLDGFTASNHHAQVDCPC